ncbi:unnamed protein product, partial [Pylaiella littoralis]
ASSFSRGESRQHPRRYCRRGAGMFGMVMFRAARFCAAHLFVCWRVPSRKSTSTWPWRRAQYDLTPLFLQGRVREAGQCGAPSRPCYPPSHVRHPQRSRRSLPP